MPIKVTVIAAAKYPSNSPLALALRKMNYADAHVTQHFAYISGQGEIAENIFAYECELEELVQ